jgi:hypothetical protein
MLLVCDVVTVWEMPPGPLRLVELVTVFVTEYDTA